MTQSVATIRLLAVLSAALWLTACNLGEDALENVEVDFSMHHTRFDSSSGAFEELPAPEFKRAIGSLHPLGGKLYYVGGLDEQGNYTSALEAYDIGTQTWEQLANWPNPGLGFFMVVGDQLCAVGGFKNLEELVRREVDCFDPATGRWSERARVPMNYAGFVPINLGDKVYIFGGIASDWSLLDDCWLYDLATDEWSELASLPFGFTVGRAVPLDGKIYLVGGLKGDSVDQAVLDGEKDTDTLVYDVATDAWSTAPDMPHPRIFYGADAIEDHVAVFFGIGDDGPLVEFYNPTSDQWVAGTNPVDGPEDGAYTYVRHQDEMHLFTLATAIDGSSVEASGKMWHYSFANDEWSVIGQRTEGKDALFNGASLGSAIHFVGAHTTVTY